MGRQPILIEQRQQLNGVNEALISVTQLCIGVFYRTPLISKSIMDKGALSFLLLSLTESTPALDIRCHFVPMFCSHLLLSGGF